MRYIAAGNEEEAASVLQMILRHNWEEQELPVSMCRCLAYDLLCGILRCLGTMPEVWEQQRRRCGRTCICCATQARGMR